MSLKFICPENGEYGNKSVEINIPERCPTCDEQLLIAYNSGMYSTFDNCCDHTQTYKMVWDLRLDKNNKVIQASAYGVNCKSCNEHFPYAEAIDGFKCWNCKTYPHYK